MSFTSLQQWTLMAAPLLVMLASQYVSTKKIEPDTMVFAAIAAVIFILARTSADVWESAVIDILGMGVVSVLALSFLWYSAFLDFCGTTALSAASLGGVDPGHRADTACSAPCRPRRLIECFASVVGSCAGGRAWIVGAS